MARAVPRARQRLLRVPAGRAAARRARRLRVDLPDPVPGVAALVRHVAGHRLARGARRPAALGHRRRHLPRGARRARLRPVLHRRRAHPAGRRAGAQLPADGARHPGRAGRLGARPGVRAAAVRPDRPLRRRGGRARPDRPRHRGAGAGHRRRDDRGARLALPHHRAVALHAHGLAPHPHPAAGRRAAPLSGRGRPVRAQHRARLRRLPPRAAHPGRHAGAAGRRRRRRSSASRTCSCGAPSARWPC